MSGDSPVTDEEIVAAHNHVTRDIKPVGQCPACDAYWGTNWGDPHLTARAAALTATPNHGTDTTT